MILAPRTLGSTTEAAAMPEITETAEIGVSTDVLWNEIGGFGAVGDWHPMLERLDVWADGSRAPRAARTGANKSSA
jgi:hypothetical protein